MSNHRLPLLLEPDELEAELQRDDLLVVDLCRTDVYARLHIPGAVHLDYHRLTAGGRPAPGLLPPVAQLTEALADIGLAHGHHVVAYDDEGGGKAGRLLWTLDVLGHPHYSLLNGGLHAWANEGHPLSNSPHSRSRGAFEADLHPGPLADKEFLLQSLGRPDLVLLDARTPEEFSGQRRFAQRGGHIPGAVNLDWMLTMDRQRNLRLKPAAELQATLAALGVTPDKQVVTYCQTHHRSSHSYAMLKALGYPRLKAYPGSWSEWGNLPDTPIEC